jgi:nucleoside 2-deoxyribosyltransferase
MMHVDQSTMWRIQAMAKAGAKKKTCFVIMPFKNEEWLPQVYQLSIEPVIRAAGFTCLRADKIPKAGFVLEHILKAVYDADVVIADITGNNANVMYELGLAHGFAKPVIVLSQNIAEAPFDLKSYRIILYKTTFGADADLRREIKSALEATLHSPDTKDRSNPTRLFIPTAITAAEAIELQRRNKELEDANKRLEGMRDLAQSIIDTLGGDESLEQIQEGMESPVGSGSVRIDVQAAEEGRSRLIFTKIPPDQKVDLTPRKK